VVECGIHEGGVEKGEGGVRDGGGAACEINSKNKRAERYETRED